MTSNANKFSFKFPFPDDIMWNIFLVLNNPILLTHICRGWRSFVINSPLLWTEINVDHYHSRQDVFLSRSRASPISVQLCSESHSTCNACARRLLVILNKHISRIRALTLVVDQDNSAAWTSVSECLSAHKAPLLRVLSLHGCPRQSRPGMLALAAASFPPQLDGLAMLRVLHIHDFFPRNTMNLRNLTSLEISFETTSYTWFGSEVSSFVDVLEQCCKLQTITITATPAYTNRIATMVKNVPKKDIILPSLSEFHLSTSSQSMLEFFTEKIRSLKPIDWDIKLLIGSRKSSYLELKTIMGGSLRGQKLTLICIICISLADKYPVVAPASLMHNILHSDQDAHIFLNLNIVLLYAQSQALEVAAKIPDSQITISPPYSSSLAVALESGSWSVLNKALDWQLLLRELPTLIELSLELPDSRLVTVLEEKKAFIEQLAATLTQSPEDTWRRTISDPRKQLFCPLLSSLEIKNSLCWSAESLLQCFQKRNACGLRLRSLRLTGDCGFGVSTRWMEAAKAAIDEVHFSKATQDTARPFILMQKSDSGESVNLVHDIDFY